MQSMQAPFVVQFALKEIISEVNNRIEIVELLKNVPTYIQHKAMRQTATNVQAMILETESNSRVGMRQQHLSEICAQPKDSLMPKGVERESQQIDQVSIMEVSEAKNKRRVVLATNSSIKNRTGVNSLNMTNKTSNFSVASTKKKTVKQSNLIALPKEDEDPEITKLMKKKDYEYAQKDKARKEEEKRDKQFKQKQSAFLQELKDKEYTFSFDGDPIVSAIEDDKICYNSIKMRLAAVDRKMKSNLKYRPAADEQVKYAKRKMSNLDGLNNQSGNHFMSIPVFDSLQSSDPGRAFGISTDVKNYGLKDYKKHYGGRYNRLQKTLHTIELASEKGDEFNQLFSERRHFKGDEKSLNQSMASSISRDHSGTRRKLALPKIKGKYSTLDRYESNIDTLA